MVVSDERGGIEGLEGGEHGLHVGGAGGGGLGAAGGGGEGGRGVVVRHRAARALRLARVHGAGRVGLCT